MKKMLRNPIDPKKIRALRQLCGWSQSDLGERLCVTWVTVSNWERGTTSPAPVHRRNLEKLMQSTIISAN